MRNLTVALTAALGLSLAGTARADLDLPRPSPASSVTQRIGLTDVTVTYFSPGVKDRKIFGELVPFNELWRTGANACTKMTFSADVKVAGKDVPAGTYCAFTIPTEKEWTFILSKNAEQGGTGSYKEADDQMRAQVKTSTIPKRERMTFVFADYDDDKGELNLEWDTTRVHIPIEVTTTPMAMANIDKVTATAWRDYASAARHLRETKGDLDRALTLANHSVLLNDAWYNNYIKAQILADMGQYADAYKAAKVAWDLGEKDKNFFFKDMVKKSLDEWKGKKNEKKGRS